MEGSNHSLRRRKLTSVPEENTRSLRSRKETSVPEKKTAKKKPECRDINTCQICLTNESDDLNFGKLQSFGADLSVHYFCLLTSNTRQKGEDYEGIFGYLTADIKSFIYVLRKTTRLCFYCKKPFPAIQCNFPKCKNKFHLSCGKYKCLTDFSNNFVSYCHLHIPKKQSMHRDDINCNICLENMGPYDIIKSIYLKCCENGWIHIQCLQKYALQAGYKLRCILCDDVKFRDYAREVGVYVPDKDASFAGNESLLNNFYHCDARDCLCPISRSFLDRDEFEIFMCINCAGFGIHRKCSDLLDAEAIEYECSQCTRLLYNSQRSSLKSEYINQLTDQQKRISPVPVESPELNESSEINESPEPIESSEIIESPEVIMDFRGTIDLTINESDLTPEDLFIEVCLPTIYMPKPLLEK